MTYLALKSPAASPQRGRTPARPHILVLSRNFPNPGMPIRGLWAQRFAQIAAQFADVTVVAPVPWLPIPVPRGELSLYRSVPARRRESDGTTVWHPRVPAGYAQAMHGLDAVLTWAAVKRCVDQVHSRHPVSLIHAHFVYPDGVVAARLGRRLGVPVVTSEHSFWRPWLDAERSAWRQVEAALPHIHTIGAVSKVLEREIAAMVGGRARTAVIPNVLDDRLFAPDHTADRDPNRLLFVGLIRRVKGLDVLVRALAKLRSTRPRVRLRVVGTALLRGYDRDEQEVRDLVNELGLSSYVEFVGGAEPSRVSIEMRSAAMLVVPSRRESFCSVIAESLASGTPVVATRCGGPEELIADGCGRLVTPEDHDALAEAIDQTLERAATLDSTQLRRSVVGRFGMAASRTRLHAWYESIQSEWNSDRP